MSTSKKHPAKTNELYALAKAARLRSYSPYSRHKVGAALRLADGRVFTGCNIENSSYGGTVCAERTAVFKAVSESDGPISIAEIVVVTDASPPWPPCGLCRQVLSEFSGGSTLVHGANLKSQFVSNTFAELMPNAFTPGHLKKR